MKIPDITMTYRTFVELMTVYLLAVLSVAFAFRHYHGPVAYDAVEFATKADTTFYEVKVMGYRKLDGVVLK